MISRWDNDGECLIVVPKWNIICTIIVESLQEACNTKNNSNGITSDFLSLMKEQALLSMWFFLEDCCVKHWLHYFTISKQSEKTSDQYDYVAGVMCLHYFAKKNNIEELTIVFSIKIHFKIAYIDATCKWKRRLN